MPKKAANKQPDKPKPAAAYESLQAELNNVVAELQREDLDVDSALAHYRRGLELVRQLEHYLSEAENKITELQSQSGRQ